MSQEVWVAISGCYSSQNVDAVYSSAAVGMAANPVPATPRTPPLHDGWRHIGDGGWSNGLDLDDSLILERFVVDEG